MNSNFFSDVLLPVIHRWNVFYKGKHKHKYFDICIESRNKTGIIQIKDNGKTDLIVRDSTDSKNFNFWTNFMADDMERFIKLLSLFFEYLVLSNKKDSIPGISSNNTVKRILITCDTGLSSSYFAYSLMQIFNDYGIDFLVDGVAISDVHKYVNEYDVILITHKDRNEYEKYIQISEKILMIG